MGGDVLRPFSNPLFGQLSVSCLRLLVFLSVCLFSSLSYDLCGGYDQRRCIYIELQPRSYIGSSEMEAFVFACLISVDLPLSMQFPLFLSLW